MKLATFERSGEARLGAVLGERRLVDLNRAAAALARSRGVPNPVERAAASVPSDATAFLALGRPAFEAAREALDHVEALAEEAAERELLALALAATKLLPPVPRPPKILCVARNYAEHAREAGLELTEIPMVFARFTNTLVGDGGAIIAPRVSEQLDWEGELAVVIGKGGGHIARGDALSHVAGYSIFNDVTVRDYQFRVTQYTAGKNFRASGPCGPYLVSADELGDAQALEITTTVNGEVKQSASTADMLFDVPALIEHISEWIDLEPGDVIATGTPAGVGFKRSPPEFLRAGDSVAVTISGLGTLANTVVAE